MNKLVTLCYELDKKLDHGYLYLFSQWLDKEVQEPALDDYRVKMMVIAKCHLIKYLPFTVL